MKKYIILVACFLVLTTFLLVKSPVIKADISSDLFFSEYIEGASPTANNKALEIYNPGSSSVDLSAYSIKDYANGNLTSNTTYALSGTLLAGDVVVVCNSSSTTELSTQCDLLAGGGASVVGFNGNDTVVLLNGTTVIDVIGKIGEDPGASGWGVGNAATLDHVLVRKCSVMSGDANGSDVFDPSIQWDGYPANDYSHLGSHTLCISTPTPSATPTEVPSDTPTVTPTPTPTPTETPTPTPTVTPTVTPCPTQIPDSTPTCSPSATPTPTVCPIPFPRLPVFTYFVNDFMRRLFPLIFNHFYQVK